MGLERFLDMLGFGRISQKELARLCRRLGTSLEAGVDLKKTLQHEAAGRAAPGLRLRLFRIHDEVSRGTALGEAVRNEGEYFPSLFREMVAVGEETGKLPEIFNNLADHYDHQLLLRRMFLAAIAWPMFQLGAAVCVIGLLIFILGILPAPAEGQRADVLGLGLVGVPGVIAWFALVGAAAAAGYLVYLAAQRGVFWTRPLQKAALAVPVLGRCLQTFCLSRLAWSLHLTLETSMDLKQALALALGSTRNARYTDHIPAVAHAVTSGQEIHEALEETRAFPRDFLDALEVGERSGKLPETMSILSRQYQDQARRALATLTVLAGFAVWALVAALIIVLIFRLFTIFILAPYKDLGL